LTPARRGKLSAAAARQLVFNGGGGGGGGCVNISAARQWRGSPYPGTVRPLKFSNSNFELLKIKNG